MINPHNLTKPQLEAAFLKLQGDNTELLETVEFYANEANYEKEALLRLYSYKPRIAWDLGDRARKTLRKVGHNE